MRASLSLLGFFTVGLAPWLIPNAVFGQIPAISDSVPEGAGIGAWTSLAIQLSNVAPLLYLWRAHRCETPPLPQHCIQIVLPAMVVAAVLIGCTWRVTLQGTVSVMIYVGSFAAGCCGGLCNVTLWEWAASYRPEATVALGTGLSSGGLLVAMFLLVQQPGNDHPLFATNVFMFGMAAVLLLPWTCFWLIQVYTQPCSSSPTGPMGSDEELLGRENEATSSQVSSGAPPSPNGGNKSTLDEESERTADSEENHHLQQKMQVRPWDVASSPSDCTPSTALDVCWAALWHLVCLFWCAFCQYGLLPSVLPYAAQGYPSDKTLLNWCTIASMIAPAVGSSVSALWQVQSILVPCILWSAAIVYVMASATSHGSPPFHREQFGAPLLLVAVSTFGLFAGYGNTMLFVLLRKDLAPNQVSVGSQLGGAATQIGTCLGAGVATLLVAFDAMEGKL